MDQPRRMSDMTALKCGVNSCYLSLKPTYLHTHYQPLRKKRRYLILTKIQIPPEISVLPGDFITELQ